MRTSIIGLAAVLLLLGTTEVEAISIHSHHKHEKKKHHHKKKHHKKAKKEEKEEDEEEDDKEDTTKTVASLAQTATATKEAEAITAKADEGLKTLDDNDASLSDMLSFSKAIANGKTAQEALVEE